MCGERIIRNTLFLCPVIVINQKRASRQCMFRPRIDAIDIGLRIAVDILLRNPATKSVFSGDYILVFLIRLWTYPL